MKGAGHKQNGPTIDCLLVFLHFDRNSICDVLLVCSRAGDWQPGTFGRELVNHFSLSGNSKLVLGEI